MIIYQSRLVACGLALAACSPAPGPSARSSTLEGPSDVHSGTAAVVDGTDTLVDDTPSGATSSPIGSSSSASGDSDATGVPPQPVAVVVEDETSLILASPEGPAAPTTCAGETYEAELLPVDIYFLVDISGSMAERTPNGTKWDLVSQALVDFLDAPSNADTGVGIGYFPLGAPPTCTSADPDCFCIPFTPICITLQGGSCDIADYGPAVPLTLPPDHAPVISDMGSRSQAGGTPTRVALESALDYASTWSRDHPGRRTVVVLATDGEPTGCGMNAPADVAAVAAAAFAGPQQIRTFVVGVGRSLTSLDLIAEQGGTTQAFLTDTNEDLASELSEALNRIRTQAVQCEFSIPTGDDDVSVDTGLVNVVLTPAGADSELVPMTLGGSAADCDAGGGWYYDNPAAPTSIQLCESTCQAAQAGARVEIEYGCETVTVRVR